MKPNSSKVKTTLEMRTLPNGRTETRLLYGGVDISDRIMSLSLHVHPGSPVSADVSLMIDEMHVDVEIAENIVRAMIPEIAPILDGSKTPEEVFGYDGPGNQSASNPETFG